MTPRRLLAAALLVPTLAACTSSAANSGDTVSSPASTTPSSSAASSAAGSAAASSSASASSSAPAPVPPASAPLAGPEYVSIGDSYAAGYQPTGRGQGGTTRNGFAYQLVTAAAAKGQKLTLVNFGCSGATTTSVLQQPGCPAAALGPGAPRYTGTQAAAAESYLRAHRGKVGLVTVSLGGNDVTKCGLVANPLTCLTPALETVKKNLATLLTGLRAAAGPKVRIVGITYPDVLLGLELSKDPKISGTGQLSVLAFQSLINPALKSAYEAVGGSFVDVTAATGAYGPSTATTTLPPYGTIPVPVATVCTLTYFCQYQDIHPRTNGYAVIAKLIAALLPKA